MKGANQYPVNRILNRIRWGDITHEQVRSNIENGVRMRNVGTIAIALYCLIYDIKPLDNVQRCRLCGQLLPAK